MFLAFGRLKAMAPSRSDPTPYALIAKNLQYVVQAYPYGMSVAHWDCDFEEADLGLAEVAPELPNWCLKAQEGTPQEVQAIE